MTSTRLALCPNAHRDYLVKLVLIVLSRLRNMELNRAQLLVHDDTVIEKFMRDHDIPNNVLIERSGP